MTPTIVIRKIATFEMLGKMGRQEEPTSSRPYAFASDERKGKKKAPTPSSSSEEEEEEENDDEEEKIINHQHHPLRTKKQSDASKR